MPGKDRNSGGSLVLDVIGQYHVKTISDNSTQEAARLADVVNKCDDK